MNIHYKQSQFELFPHPASGTEQTIRPSFFFSSITLSLENLIISGILMLLFVVFSFAVGVERGKKIVFSSNPVSVTAKPAAAIINLPVQGIPKTKPSGVMSAPVVAKPLATEIARKNEKTLKAVEPVKPQDNMSSGYTVQVASYAKMEFAQKEATALKKKGVEAFILGKGKYLIVCAGKFSGKDDAKVVLNRLQKSYKDCVIRRL